MASINLDKLKELGSRLRRKPTDVVGLDIARSAIKAVRARKVNDQIALVAADILPAVSLPRIEGGGIPEVAALELSQELSAKYASIVVSGGRNTIVKMLNFPGRADQMEDASAKIVEGLGIEDPGKYRIGYRFLAGADRRSESKAIVAAVPEAEIAGACRLLPAGVPAPYSLEVSGLASMTAFLHGPAAANPDEATGMIDFGADTSYFSIFHKTTLLLVRKFDVGSGQILEKVQQSLGIDQATAEGIIADGSFDISQQIGDVLDSFVKQIIVSRDFVERRENCKIGKVYASGGVTACRDWLLEVKTALGYDVEAWNPFDVFLTDQVQVPEHLRGQESRFTAAIGAVLSTLLGEAG